MQTQSQVELGLAGKVVLVTGGARGVGAGITRVLASAGAVPVICGRNPDSLAEDLRDVAFVSCDVRDAGAVEAMIAEIDRKLSEQLNLILHHEKFQQLEGSWRGLKYLVSNTETDRMLKIRVMNVSKKELAKELRKYKGSSWDQSPLFRKIYSEEYGQLGGAPYGALIGDYYFDHTPQDVELLGQIAQIARMTSMKSAPMYVACSASRVTFSCPHRGASSLHTTLKYMPYAS